MELMVAMAITTIIVTVLVSITSIAIDTWNRSRAELRAARQARSMVESMARDFEALVTRRGSDTEWLSAVRPQTQPGERLASSNSAEMIFFTAATDRYNGNIGSNTDMGGDVSCVGYRLRYADPVGTAPDSKFKTFVLNRLLVNPDDTFKDLLGKPDLATAFGSYKPMVEEPQNFVCENVFQFTVTFHIEVTVPSTTANTPPTIKTRQISIGDSGTSTVQSFRIKGTGNEIVPEDLELKSGRIKAVEISLTVISDAGIDQLRNRPFKDNQQAEFMAKNAYNYTKLVQIPSM
jgi:type II secretory pathway pseudopilin PulG